MTKVRVAGFSISLDGFGAGPDQSLENPLGRRGLELHQWSFGTRTFRAMTGEGGGSEGVDEAYAHRSMDGFGAFILGRNMALGRPDTTAKVRADHRGAFAHCRHGCRNDRDHCDICVGCRSVA